MFGSLRCFLRLERIISLGLLYRRLNGVRVIVSDGISLVEVAEEIARVGHFDYPRSSYCSRTVVRRPAQHLNL